MKVILLGELRGKRRRRRHREVAQGCSERLPVPNKIAQPATPGNIKRRGASRNIAKARRAAYC